MSLTLSIYLRWNGAAYSPNVGSDASYIVKFINDRGGNSYLSHKNGEDAKIMFFNDVKQEWNSASPGDYIVMIHTAYPGEERLEKTEFTLQRTRDM